MRPSFPVAPAAAAADSHLSAHYRSSGKQTQRPETGLFPCWLNSELDGIVQPVQALPASCPISERRLQVHRAVRELMSEQGFRISMDAVAARAGCSKQTLYAHFGSKQELMRSVIQEHLDIATASLDEAEYDPRKALMGFAMQHLGRLSDPLVVSACQLLAAEAGQFPEAAQAIYRDGSETLQQRLADWLGKAMARGQLRQDDPHYSAELLMGMIAGLEIERIRFAVPPRDGEAHLARWAAFAIDAFLRAFAPVPTPAAGQ